MLHLQIRVGVIAIIAFARAISENRRAVPWRPVVVGRIFALALIMRELLQVKIAFEWINEAAYAIALGDARRHVVRIRLYRGGALPFELKRAGREFILGFQALPVVLVSSVLSSLLFYIMPPVVAGFPWRWKDARCRWCCRPLHGGRHFRRPGRGAVVHPALSRKAYAERMFIVMTGGMAGITAGTVFVLYATILANAIPDAAGHIVARSRCSARRR